MGAEEFVPKTHTLDSLRAAAAGCKACDLWEAATQTYVTNAVKHFR